MKDTRTANATRNVIFGVINRFVTLVLPFVTRTIVLYLFGASFLGIGTLFSSILSFLSLAELGLGTAIVYTMYRPIAENDYIRLNALLNYYRKLYRIIGLVILVIGTLLVPAVPFLIKKDPPAGINVYLLYYLYLINSVVSYFFAGYKQSLLAAHQRNDITSNITTGVNLFVQFGQIFILYCTKNFYAYAIIPIIGTLITNALNSYITNKKYPNIKCTGEIDSVTRKGIYKRLSGLFGTKLNSIVVHSADVMVISAFLGLSMTAQYGNYYYIMNAICGFIMVMYSSLTAGIGNKLVTDSLEENYSFFKKLSFVNAWIAGWCSVCLLCLYEPFMHIWVGDKLKLGMAFVICMVGYFFVYTIQRTVLTFKDAAGLWSEDKLRPYVSMIVNIVSNLVLVRIIGIYGIVLSTIIAFTISLPWANYVLYKKLFKKPPIKNIIGILRYLLITLVAALPTYLICIKIPDGIGWFLCRAVICCVVPNLIFWLFFRKFNEYKYFKNIILLYKSKLIKNILKRKAIG